MIHAVKWNEDGVPCDANDQPIPKLLPQHDLDSRGTLGRYTLTGKGKDALHSEQAYQVMKHLKAEGWDINSKPTMAEGMRRMQAHRTMQEGRDRPSRSALPEHGFFVNLNGTGILQGGDGR